MEVKNHIIPRILNVSGYWGLLHDDSWLLSDLDC